MASSLPVTPPSAQLIESPGKESFYELKTNCTFCYQLNHHRRHYNILFLPPHSFTLLPFIFTAAPPSAASYSVTYVKLSLLWWIHKSITMTAHRERFMETHYIVSIFACPSPSLAPPDAYTSLNCMEKWKKQHSDVKSLTVSSLWSVLIRLWTLGRLIHLVRQQSNCLLATLRLKLLIELEKSQQWYKLWKTQLLKRKHQYRRLKNEECTCKTCSNTTLLNIMCYGV